MTALKHRRHAEHEWREHLTQPASMAQYMEQMRARHLEREHQSKRAYEVRMQARLKARERRSRRSIAAPLFVAAAIVYALAALLGASAW